jgi:hypothetical protein
LCANAAASDLVEFHNQHGFQGFSQQLRKAVLAHPNLMKLYTRYQRAGYLQAALAAKVEFEQKHGPTVKSKAAEEQVRPGK